MDIAKTYCLTSNQSRELASYLSSDREKVNFLKQTYNGIIDKENFTEVMDVLKTFSSAMRLYHMTLGAPQSTVSPNAIPQNPSCPTVMDVMSYNQLLNQVNSIPEDREKARRILNTVNSCMYTRQSIDLVSSIGDENIKLDILKRMAPFIFDIENYHQAGAVLSPNYKALFESFLQSLKPSTSVTSTQNSVMDFEEFIAAIRQQSFDKDKVDYVKTYMNQIGLSSLQIKKLIKEISFDSYRIDVAKFLFDNCTDKQNYFTVSESLQFSSSKAELNEYVKAKK
jgi:hypothetical protein